MTSKWRDHTCFGRQRIKIKIYQKGVPIDLTSDQLKYKAQAFKEAMDGINYTLIRVDESEFMQIPNYDVCCIFVDGVVLEIFLSISGSEFILVPVSYVVKGEHWRLLRNKKIVLDIFLPL